MSLSVHDRQGLVWAYQLAPPQPLGTESLAITERGAPTWLHFNLTDARARRWLGTQARLSDAALAVLLDPQPRVRVQLLPEGFVAILTDLHHDFRGDPEGFGELRLFVEKDRVISGRRHPLKTIDVVRRHLEQGVPMESPGVWLEQLITCLAHSFGELTEELVDQVDEIEDEVVGGNGKEQRSTLANIRRLLVRFRRHLHANRVALAKLPTRVHDGGEASARLRSAIERLDGVAQDLDLVHERVRLLQDELAGLLAEASSRNLYVLSIMTTVLLPTTVVTGLWGMNVGGLPWADDPRGFLWVGLVVLGSVILSLLLLRGSRVL